MASDSILVISGSDVTPPTVSFTNPGAGGNVFANSHLILSASAADEVGVTKVEFYVNGSRKCSVTSSPYICAWSVPAAPGVTYSLALKAYDATGNIGTSTIFVTSQPDVTPPTVSFTNPGGGGNVFANSKLILSASATDEVGVTKVEFYVNGTRKCSDNSSPYTCAWSVPAAPGVTYSLALKAYDAAGNIGTSTIFVTSK